MLAFIDESGLPNPNDASTRPAVVAICCDEQDARDITRRLYALKRDILRSENAELKGKHLLKKTAFTDKRIKRLFAEEFFSTLGTLPVAVFASIMRSPFSEPLHMEDQLGNRFRYLLQRIELLAGERASFANVLFDGRGTRFARISGFFSNYLFRSVEGQNSIHISDTPAFVDSATSAGIQIADMCAYVVRVFQENGLNPQFPPYSDEYLLAIWRWYRTIQRLTRDTHTANGETRYGLQFLTTGER